MFIHGLEVNSSLILSDDHQVQSVQVDLNTLSISDQYQEGQ